MNRRMLLCAALSCLTASCALASGEEELSKSAQGLDLHPSLTGRAGVERSDLAQARQEKEDSVVQEWEQRYGVRLERAAFRCFGTCIGYDVYRGKKNLGQIDTEDMRDPAADLEAKLKRLLQESASQDEGSGEGFSIEAGPEAEQLIAQFGFQLDREAATLVVPGKATLKLNVDGKSKKAVLSAVPSSKGGEHVRLVVENQDGTKEGCEIDSAGKVTKLVAKQISVRQGSGEGLDIEVTPEAERLIEEFGLQLDREAETLVIPGKTTLKLNVDGKSKKAVLSAVQAEAEGGEEPAMHLLLTVENVNGTTDGCEIDSAGRVTNLVAKQVRGRR